ncbi:NUDIX hydrolase [Corynebacterium sp.]|uniref:NUDIX hydrolase n=1 Tax=Corynebacterium sp. TaxID=1720 RepID=UPI003B3AC56E
MSRPTARPADTSDREHSLQDWLDAAQVQPDLPADLPGWVSDLVAAARTESGEDAAAGIFSEPARTVPETGPDGTPPRYSAVLVLLGEDADGGTTVLLTHRNPRMRTHSGQIAFPGGRREPQDAGPVDTAVREAVEETALDPDSVVPVTVMDPLYIDRTNHAVIPVIAWWRAPGPVRPATQESDWVRAYPVARLAAPASRSRIGFLGWHGPAFDVDGYLLWGFTGGVVDALLRIAGWDETWEDPWSDGAPAAVGDLFAALEASRNGENLAADALGDRMGGELGSGEGGR